MSIPRPGESRKSPPEVGEGDRLTTGDEAILKRISERSGGRYFRATDPQTLEQILRAIDPIERQDVKISETRDYRELYPWLLLPMAPVMAIVLAFSFLGDGLRDAIDPHE